MPRRPSSRPGCLGIEVGCGAAGRAGFGQERKLASGRFRARQWTPCNRRGFDRKLSTVWTNDKTRGKRRCSNDLRDGPAARLQQELRCYASQFVTRQQVRPMRRSSTALVALLVLVLATVAWGPWLPDRSSLKEELAIAQQAQWAHLGATRTTFKTQSGAEVSLICGGRSPTCQPNEMQRLIDQQAQVHVWHDGQVVYQIASARGIILPYERIYEGRPLILALALAALVALLIRIAMHLGLINVVQADRRSVS